MDPQYIFLRDQALASINNNFKHFRDAYLEKLEEYGDPDTAILETVRHLSDSILFAIASDSSKLQDIVTNLVAVAVFYIRKVEPET